MLTIGLDKPGCASTCAPPGGGRDQASQMNVDEPWTIRILLRIRRLGLRVPPARHRFPRSRVGPSAAGSSSTASGRILATGELRPLYDTATEPGGGVVERAVEDHRLE